MPFGLAELTFSLDTSAYGSGDVLADTQELASFFPASGHTVVLRSVVLIDEDDQGIALDLHFFDSNVSLGTENAAPNISDANLRTSLGSIAIAGGDYKDLGGARSATLRGLDLFLKGAAGSTSLWVGAVTGGTPTHTASGLRLRLGYEWH